MILLAPPGNNAIMKHIIARSGVPILSVGVFSMHLYTDYSRGWIKFREDSLIPKLAIFKTFAIIESRSVSPTREWFGMNLSPSTLFGAAPGTASPWTSSFASLPSTLLRTLRRTLSEAKCRTRWTILNEVNPVRENHQQRTPLDNEVL